MTEKKKLMLSVETLCQLGGGKRPGQARVERDTPTEHPSCTCFVAAQADRRGMAAQRP